MTSADITLRHSNCFKLLAACFYEPEKALFQEEKVLENLRDLFLSLSPTIVEGMHQPADVLDKNSDHELKVDYAALFVGPFELLAAPYGSVYLEKGGRVLGDSTIAVQKCYEKAGLMPDVQEPADHIAIELEFLYFLSAQETDALMSGRDADAQRCRAMQMEFMNEFMGWIPEFCRRIEKSAQTDFYKLIAQLLASFFGYCRYNYLPRPVMS